jgi:hypothetical protein
MKSIISIVFLVGLLLTSTGSAKSQQQMPHDVSIWNSTKTKVNFQLSYDKNTWKDFALDGDQMNTFQTNNGELYVRLSTSPKDPKTNDGEPATSFVSYQLEEKARYKIFWNNKSKKWDLEKMKPRV